MMFLSFILLANFLPVHLENLFEGDIMLPPLSTVSSSFILFLNSFFFPQRSLVRNGVNVRWPNGIVPYEIASNYCMYTHIYASGNHRYLFIFTAAADQATIISAMRQLENSVAINNVRCVQFRPRNVSDIYYINIINGVGCSSIVNGLFCPTHVSYRCQFLDWTKYWCNYDSNCFLGKYWMYDQWNNHARVHAHPRLSPRTITT